MDKNDEIDLLRFLSLFWRRKLLICVISLPVVLLGVLYANSLQPVYRAQAKVLFEPSGSVLSGVSVQVSDALSRIESEIQMARSERILLSVLRDLGLATDARFDRQRRAVDRLLDQLLKRELDETDAIASLDQVRRQVEKMVSVRQVGRSTLLSFDAESNDPELAARLSNAFAENYIAHQMQTKVESAQKSLEVINEAITDAGDNLEYSERKLNEYIFESADAIAAASGNARIELLARDLEMVKSKLGQLELKREQLAAIIRQRQFELPAKEFSVSMADELLSELQVEIFLALQRQREGLMAQEVSEGPSKDIDEQMARIELDIEALARERLTVLEVAAALQQERKASVRTDLEVEVFKSDLPPEIAADIFKLQSSASSARTWYTNLVDRGDELAFQSRTQIADSRIVDWAIIPLSPSGPKKQQIIGLAFVLGLLTASLMALLFDRFYGGIIDPRDLQNVIGETSVCVLPKVNLNTGRASVFKHPFGYFAESLRMILAQVDGVIFSGDLVEVSRGAPRDSRVELGHQTCDQNANVIGITSSSINEGKTTTAIGLASVAALNGLETCLIDFDFRRPSVSKYMGLSEESGLMAYLADEQENLILQRMEIEDDNTICFDVISDGWRDNSFSFAAIHPARLGALLEKLKRKYDYVVVDMPPILSASETKSISKQCDAVVFCARKSFCSRRTIVEGYNALNSVQPNLKKSVFALTCSPSKLNNQNYYYKNYAAK